MFFNNIKIVYKKIGNELCEIVVFCGLFVE